ncbi:asparaginase [Rhizobium sp. EC-SD404]|uniref:asparaginase n=1 Tax=Rhizobium sp. EC-SD404 TaxID=2038389 RepID=UPI00125C41B9|nr:asparaginase [Rhizobium sp. EC-SD404]VVT13739.1 L-asparaginase II [Rhizobium sp. EC-SD404]
MSNPVLVEVTRGALVESRHRGAVAVVDAEGKMVLGIGDVERPVFPRSAVKTMQALPLIESGAADAFGFGDAELSLACASHSGEAEHVALAASMLRRAGREADVLECGCHWPFDQHVLIELAKSGKAPTVLHNNCSGKHAGFIATSVHAEIPTEGYVSYDHPIQREIRGVMEALTGTQLGTDNCGTDGCAIPTYAVPLDRLADGFSRMLTGRGLEAERAKAARRLIDGCMAEPFYMSGSKRACLNLMQAAPGRIFAKTGAEGVFCAVLPEQGLGIALKCDDGGTRASEAMIAGLLARLMGSEDPAYAALDALANKTLRNWNGTEVGKIRATDALTR